MLNVSGRVKKALLERGWTQKKLCGEIEVTETGFKRMSENNTWKLETLEKIAAVLDLPIVYFFDEREPEEADRTKVSSGDGYLRDLVNKLEANFNNLSEQFASQLSAKDSQIADLQESRRSLQDMLKMVLGKFKGVTFTQLSEEEVFELTMGMYKHAGLRVALGQTAGKPRRFKMPTRAKSVALSLT